MPWTALSNVAITIGIPGVGAIGQLFEKETLGGLDLSREIASANAAYIVKAVNAHEALLKLAVELKKRVSLNHDGEEFCEYIERVITRAEGK